jgi:hypothetical protein
MRKHLYYDKRILEVLERNMSFHHVMLDTDVRYWAKYNFPTLLRYM